MRIKKTDILWLSAALIAAAFLRLKGLTFQSLWLDELINLSHSAPSKTLPQIFAFCRDAEHTPPLFYLLTWFWQSIWEAGEYWARLLPVIFGISGVAAVFFLGRRLFSTKVGLVAAYLTAFLPFHIEYSQEVRPYSLLFLTAALSYLFLLRLLEKPSGKNLIYYSLSTSLLCYTHYYGLFLFAAQIIFLTLYLSFAAPRLAGPLFRYLLLSVVLIIISYLPWGPALFRMAGTEEFWPPRPRPGFFLAFFKGYFGHEPYLTSVVSFLILVYLLGVSKKERFSKNKLLLASWIFIVLFIPYFSSLTSAPILIRRYTIAVLPAVILMAARGVLGIREVVFRWFLFATIILMLIFNLFYTRGNYYTRVRKEQWRQAAEFVIERDPGGRYPVSGSGYFKYYFNRVFKSPRVFIDYIRTRGDAVSLRKQVQKEKISGFWILEGHASIPKGVRDFLDNHFQRAASVELKKTRATLYLGAPDRRRINQGESRPSGAPGNADR